MNNRYLWARSLPNSPAPSPEWTSSATWCTDLLARLLSIALCVGLSACACLCVAPGGAAPSSVPLLPIPDDAILPTPSDSTGAPAAGRFAVSDDGAATFSYPIWVPDGRRGLQPSISLVYNSRDENGLVGVGWRLKGLSSITRCKRDMARDGYNAAIQFDSTDAFCLDGQRLVAFPGVPNGVTGTYGAEGTEYRTEEERFSRIINGPTDDKGPLSFEVRLADGRIFFYGTSLDSRFEGNRVRISPASLSGTAIQRDFQQIVRLTWSLSEVRDRSGNNITVQYTMAGDPRNQQGYEQLPQSIHYTGTVDQSLPARRVVSFEYESRPDAQTTFVSGLMLQMRHRLVGIALAAPDPVDTALIKSYVLQYEGSIATERSLLTKISECDPQQVCLAPTTFLYSHTPPDGFTDVDTGIHDDSATGETTPSVGRLLDRIVIGDIDGDGCDDLIFSAYDYLARGLDMAAFRLSSCYDAILAGSPPLPAPTPNSYLQLSPPLAGAPDSAVPPLVFNPPFLMLGEEVCNSSAELIGCWTQLTGVDFDLDGRTDLLSYFVTEDCGNPFPPGCDFSTTWNQSFSTSIFLASSIPPAQWNPSSGLYAGETHGLVVVTTPKRIFTQFPPNSVYYTSTYVGDINGDGYPDLVQLTPNGWSFRLNHGRAVLPPPLQNCGSAGRPCLSLGASSALFPGSAPIFGLTNVFMTDVFKEGTASLILRDVAGSNWYAAFRLSARNCPAGTAFCPVLPVPNLALVAGDAYRPARRDWFMDLNRDGLPDSISIPITGGHPYVSINTGNGFDTPAMVAQGAPVRAGNLAVLDYDGNGTQDFVYTTAATGADAVAWLSVDMKGDGATQIVQVWDNHGKLGMIVWSPNGNDSYSELWSSDDMGQGSGAIAWLPVQMQGDGKTQIAQLWSNHGRLAMIVWGPNADGSYSQIWGSNDLGQSSGAIKWLPVQMQGDGKTQIVQLDNHQGKLVMIVWGPNADGSYSQIWGSNDMGVGSNQDVWLPVQMQGDGKTQIAQLWDNHGKLAMQVWGPNADGSYSPIWTSNDMGQGSGAKAWLPVQMQGDGATQIVQVWDNHGKLGMIVWGPNADGSYSQMWSSDDMGQGSGAIAWLPVRMKSDHKTQIAQLWNHSGKLGMIVWGPNADGSYSQMWSSDDMGQGFAAVKWLTADLQPGSETRILQMWGNTQKLGMNVWVPHSNGSYAQAWGSSDMAGYLYVMLTHDSADQFRSLPLVDQHGYPIPSGSKLQAFDVNGDGLMDLVQIVDGVVHVYIRKGSKRNLLAGILDRGPLISVSYAPLASHSIYGTSVPPGVVASSGSPTIFSPGYTYVLNKGPWVVTSYSLPRAGSLGPTDPTNQYSFTYADARNDLLGRGWLGFGQIQMTDHQTQKQTVTTYDNATRVGSAYPFAHRPKRVESMVTLSDSRRINVRVQATTYQRGGASDGSYVIVLPQDVLRQEFEGPSTDSMDLIRSIDTSFEYDGFGNVTKVSRKAGDGYSEERSDSFQQNVQAWLVSLKTRSVVSSVVPSGVRETRTATFSPDPDTGITLEETIEPNGTDETYLHLARQYDAHGVQTGSTLSDKSGRRKRHSEAGYDSEHIYPAFSINALGHTERVAVHPALGVAALYEDANGVREKRQHDTFGRLRTVLPAGGGNLFVTYPLGAAREIDVTDAAGHSASVFSDAFQNVIERDWKAFDGQTAVLLSSYNGQGLLAESDGPCYYGPAPCSASGSENYSYDELGRLIGVTHADGSARKTTHSGLTTTYFDELSNQRYVVQDQLGRLAKSVVISDNGHEIPASYRYAPFGLLASITDPANNTFRIKYDVRGRILALQDQDRGGQTFHWSPFGELRESARWKRSRHQVSPR